MLVKEKYITVSFLPLDVLTSAGLRRDAGRSPLCKKRLKIRFVAMKIKLVYRNSQYCDSKRIHAQEPEQE